MLVDKGYDKWKDAYLRIELFTAVVPVLQALVGPKSKYKMCCLEKFLNLNI